MCKAQKCISDDFRDLTRYFLVVFTVFCPFLTDTAERVLSSKTGFLLIVHICLLYVENEEKERKKFEKDHFLQKV